MSRAYDRIVLAFELIDADHKGDRGALRKKYRLSLVCGHTKDRWVETRIPSTSRCHVCKGEMAEKGLRV